MVLNDLERRNGPYFALFTEFGKPAFQFITGLSGIKLVDLKSASITHRTVKLVCVIDHEGVV